MTNPYGEMPFEALEEHLVEVDASWVDLCDRQSRLAQEGESIQTHRRQILEAMGVSVIGITI